MKNAAFAPIAELAKKFGVSDITIYRTYQSKQVHRKKVDGVWQYNVGEFSAYYKANKDRILEKQKARKGATKATKRAATTTDGEVSSDLMSVIAAAKKFGVKPARLYYHIEAKNLSVVMQKQGKRKVAMVNPADVQALLDGKKGVGKAVQVTAIPREARRLLTLKSNGNGHTGTFVRLALDENAVAFLGKLFGRTVTLDKTNAEGLRALSHLDETVAPGLIQMAGLLEQGHSLVLESN